MLVSDTLPSSFNYELAYVPGVPLLAAYPKLGTGGEEQLYFFDIPSGAFVRQYGVPFPAYGIDGGIGMSLTSLGWQGYIWSRTGELYNFGTASGGTDLGDYLYNHSDGTINNTPYTLINSTGTQLAGFIGDKIDLVNLVDNTLATSIDTNTGSLVSTTGIAGNSEFSHFYIIGNYTLDISSGASSTTYNVDSLYSTGICGQVWAVESGGCIIRSANGFYRIADDGTLTTSRLEHGSNQRFQFGNMIGPTSDNKLWYAHWDGSDITYYKMDCETLAIEETIDQPGLATPGASPTIAYLEDVNLFIRVSGSTRQTFIDYSPVLEPPVDMPVLERTQILLADALQEVASMDGMTVDVSDITKTFWGYTVKGDVTAREIIEDLCRIYAGDN